MNAKCKKAKNTLRKIRKNDLGAIKRVWNLQTLLLFLVLGLLSLAVLNPGADASGITMAGGDLLLAAATVGMPWVKRDQLANRLFNGGGGGGKELTEEQKALLEVFKGQIIDVVKTCMDKEMPETERKAFKDALTKMEKAAKQEDLEKLTKALADLGLKVEAIKETPQEEKLLSVKEQIKKAFTDKKAEWDKFRTEKSGEFKMEIMVDKAPATIQVSSHLGGSSYMPRFEIVPGVVPIARAQAFLEQYCNTSTTNSPVIIWVNKTNAEGNAAMTAEGGVKPLIDFEFATEKSEAKKCTAKIKISTEMLDDIDFIVGEIEGELRFQVDKVVDDQLLTGSGVGANLKGIKTYAGGYVLTSISTNSPNKFDSIAAACAQIKSLNFSPTHVFLNPIDAVNLGLTKDKNDNYIFPAWKGTDGIAFPGLTVVESNKLTVGDVIVGDMSRFNVRNYKSFTITWGWVNDDFEKNLVTVLGERRLHTYMSNNNTGAFVDDTFSAIQTAITPAP